jgi:CHAT domain-containing protein
MHYLITETQLHILLTTQEWQRVRSIQIAAKTLNSQIANLRTALRNPRNHDYRLYGKILYQSLIKPVIDDLQKAQAHTLMLSLDGVLRYIPLAALYDGQHFLLENYALVNYTDAAKAHITTPPKAKWRVAGLGLTQQVEDFSALPAVADELEAIIRQPPLDQEGIYHGVIHLDHDFNTQHLLQVLDNEYPVLHIASHFVFKPGTEKDSYLLLGDGQHLDLGRIREAYMFPQVDLLTLSACQTAMGASEKEGDGREIEGFGVLAQKNGAKSVIASLWSVDDHSTSLLMQQFYQHRQQGRNKAQALRMAQLGFISRTRKNSSYPDYFRHPYYWAAFILMGNWL